MSMLSILFCLSLVYGLVRAGSTNLEVGSPCSPPSKENINCGESLFVNETVSELSVADGYGVNLCLKETVYEVQTYSYSYRRHCRVARHGNRSRHRSRSSSRLRCTFVCERDSDECSGEAVNITKREIDCCDGFAVDPSLASSSGNRNSLPVLKTTNGCPIRLQESMLHSLLELKMIKFLLELSSADPDLSDRLWPKEVTNETFTVFALSDEGYTRLEDILPSSDVSRAILGHVVYGTIYSSMLNQGDILSPVDRNFSLHITKVPVSSERCIYINGAKINQTDASLARNGIVHIMSSFIPLSDKTIIEVLASQPDRFSTFSTLLDEAGVKQSLTLNDKSWTVLAPTNTAFEKLPEGALECMRREEHKSQLQLFVQVHISCSVEYSSTLSQRSRLPTLTRFVLVVTAENGTISLTWGKIKIIELDIPARNGVVHALSEPIVPLIDFDRLCS